MVLTLSMAVAFQLIVGCAHDTVIIKNTGPDGRTVAYPDGWNTNTGPDGRTIAYPDAWNTNTGPDGRTIAYPDGWNTNTGPDGKTIAYLDSYVRNRRDAHFDSEVLRASVPGRFNSGELYGIARAAGLVD